MYQYLIEKYGVRMTLKEAYEVLKVPVGTLYNKRSSSDLPFKTFKDGIKVFVDTRDLAGYLENQSCI